MVSLPNDTYLNPTGFPTLRHTVEFCNLPPRSNQYFTDW